MCYNKFMEQKAYAKINLILNVLGTRPDGYHEVEMLMQAIDLYDTVTVTTAGDPDCILRPQDFEYGQSDLAYKAALLMAERYKPDVIARALSEDGTELAAGIRGLQISIEKRIPAAAGLAGGSADAAAVMVLLGKLWLSELGTEELLKTLLPLGAQLGSDIPFCIASQLGHPAAIAKGRGTELEFVKAADFAVDLYFSGVSIPNKTRAVYAELNEKDCEKRFSIEAFLNAPTIEEKRRFMGNHLHAPAERIIRRLCKAGKEDLKPCAGAILCGAGPTFFTISNNGKYRSIL